jgi:transposase
MDTTAPPREPYVSDVSDDEWTFVAPYLTLMDEAAPQRRHDLREVFNGLRYIVRGGLQWRLMPHDLPPWEAVYQQTRRWMAAGSFAAIVHDLRVLQRLGVGRADEPTAAILDSRTLQSSPECGGGGGFDGAKRKKGSKVHAAVDTLGHLLALHVTPADAQDRAQVADLTAAVQVATGQTVEVAFVDKGYTGAQAASDAADHGIRLEVIKHAEAKRGFVLLPRRWVVERGFAWTGRSRRLARDDERLHTTLEGFHYVAFALLAVHQALPLLALL